MAGGAELTFEQARISILRKVRTDTDAKIRRLIKDSHILVWDSLPYEAGYRQGAELTERQKAEFAFLQQGAVMMLEVVGAHMGEALSALEAGSRVYDLLGVHSIPTYKAITDGDAHAGALSAVEDIAVLLMSLDLLGIRQEIFEETREMGALNPDLLPVYERLLLYSAIVAYDHVLMSMADGITEKLPTPRKIAYENGAVIERNGFWRDILKALTSTVHHSVRDTQRARKIPKTWPPLKAEERGRVVLSEDKVTTGHTAPVVEKNQDEIWAGLRRFNHLGFQAGYGTLMEWFHESLQENHFSVLYSPRGAMQYAARLGIPSLYEGKIREVAVSAMSDLRDRIGEHSRKISEAPFIADENVFSDGVLQAFRQIQDDIRDTELEASRNDKIGRQIMGRLKSEWNKVLWTTVLGVERGKEIMPLSPTSPSEGDDLSPG